MTGLLKEPAIVVGGQSLVVISKTVIGSHQHERCVCVFGDKSPVALVRQNKGRDEIIHILDNQIEREDIETFLSTHQSTSS